MREGVELGVRYVWMHHMLGPGSVSAIAAEYRRQDDVTVIDVANQKAIKSIKVGRYPWGVVVARF